MFHEKTYEEIAHLLWNVMPNNAKEIYFIGSIYSGYTSGGIEWITHQGDKETFPFGERPDLIEKRIRDLMFSLYQDPISNSRNWTQYSITISEVGDFSIHYHYIPEEDSWPNLYGRRISDLTWEEAYEYYIPKDIWEERVRIKNSKS